MLKKSLSCVLLLATSCSVFAAPQTEKQIADIVNRTVAPLIKEQAFPAWRWR
ncbi:Beta-lactamase precursor [Serratia fonticola]|uniref:Beta-lactamase n=1 Tax=Serratia fonticola TaxID=47917 RepID=A0A4U9U550_SERFO|nr:Beta-lactamase precursor [Serratia fonticola]